MSQKMKKSSSSVTLQLAGGGRDGASWKKLYMAKVIIKPIN